ASIIRQGRHQGRFYTAAEHAATEKKRVEIPGPPAGSHAKYGDAGQTVVAEFVGNAQGIKTMVGRGGKPPHLLEGAPNRGQIELVRLVDELRDAAEILGSRAIQLHAQLQRLQEFLLAHLRAQSVTVELGAHGVGAHAIFAADVQAVEKGEALQRRDDLRRILRQEQADDVRLSLSHVLDFHGAVVDEHEGVDADIQSLRDQRDTLRFWPPVNLPRRNMRAIKDHSPVLIEHLPNVGLVVLAGQREQHALLPPVQEELLKVAVRYAGELVSQLNSVQAVFPHNSAPQRVVAIEHHAFLGAAPTGDDDTAEQCPGLVEKTLAERLPVEVPQARIERALEPDDTLDGVEVAQANRLYPSDRLKEMIGQGPVQAAQPFCIVERERSHRLPGRKGRCSDDNHSGVV